MPWHNRAHPSPHPAPHDLPWPLRVRGGTSGLMQEDIVGVSVPGLPLVHTTLTPSTQAMTRKQPLAWAPPGPERMDLSVLDVHHGPSHDKYQVTKDRPLKKKMSLNCQQNPTRTSPNSSSQLKSPPKANTTRLAFLGAPVGCSSSTGLLARTKRGQHCKKLAG